MRILNPETVHSQGNTLGEGPFSLSENELYWLDIFENRVFCLNIAENKIEKFRMSNFICCAGITVKDGIIAAGENGVAVYNSRLQQTKSLFLPPFDINKIRFNDGKVGPDGAFWVGGMSHDGRKPIGMLLRITDRIECRLEHMLIPNGLGWSPDEKTMYITDTGKGLISEWDFNSETGRISNEKLFVSSESLPGSPDGLAVDTDGKIWSAFWGGGRVYGFSPEGVVTDEIRVNAENPTSCCFSGIGYSMLYITSARYGLRITGAADGALFKVSTGSVGKASYRFRY